MMIETNLPLLEETLAAWKPQLGEDFVPYRNHCYRMVHFCFALRDCSEDERRKVMLAATYHDLGIWSDNTVDYLPPSVIRGQEYLRQNGLQHWSEEVSLLIDQHHKLRAYKDDQRPLIEVFRKADLVDVSLGLITFGIPRATIREVKQRFPNAGFHKRLMRLSWQWFSQHPLSPPPFFKW